MRAKLSIFTSMLIWGSIGIFVKQIGLPSGIIAAFRGCFGAAILFFCIAIKKSGFESVKQSQKLPLILLSGALMGINWVLLFEAYNYTSVAVATVCYYMAPVFVTVASIFVFKEKLTLKRALCVLVAMLGTMLVSGVFGGKVSGAIGILLALGAAVLYATVVILNKLIGNVDAYQKTSLQLAVAGIAALPYGLLTCNNMQFTPKGIAFLALVCVVHTGIAYTLYFGALDKVKAATAAIISYIDPSSAVLFSAFVLGEYVSPSQFLGALLVIGAALVSEITPNFKKLN